MDFVLVLKKLQIIVTKIPLPDVLMSSFAMFSLKDQSLLAFDQRRKQGGHNLRTIFGIGTIPCDTSLRLMARL